MLSVANKTIMISVIILNVITLSIVAPSQVLNINLRTILKYLNDKFPNLFFKFFITLATVSMYCMIACVNTTYVFDGLSCLLYNHFEFIDIYWLGWEQK
jgi:hypothetical protein